LLIHLVNVSVESECPGPENRPLKCRLCQLNFRAETPVANTARAAKLISSVLTRLLVQQPLRHMELSNAPFMSVASTCWQHWDHKIREEGESLEFATWILPEIVFRLSDWDFGIMRCWDTFFDRAGFAVESMFLTLTELRRGQIGANTRYQPIRDTTGGQDAGSASSQRL
jgi:hypothetical protein